jgi:transposase
MAGERRARRLELPAPKGVEEGSGRGVSPPTSKPSGVTLEVSKSNGRKKGDPPMERRYVGIDLHRRRSVIVVMNEGGEVLETKRIVNDPVELALAIEAAGAEPEVALEACYGWYWAADVLEAAGANLHLVHPLGMVGWSNRRRKDDVADATDIAERLRLGRLPEAWLAPPELRELRELVRYRAKLVALRSGLKAQVHSVLAKQGIKVTVSDLFGARGNRLLDEVPLDRSYAIRVESLRDLIGLYDRKIAMLGAEVARLLEPDQGYKAIQVIPGVGPVLAAIFVAEIGDISRFPRPTGLAAWAGLTPRHRESDTTVIRGHITKQGSRLVRWAAVEAAQRQAAGSRLGEDFLRISASHGRGPGARKIARVAVARKIVTLVYYGLRDGEVRCLRTGAA